MAARSAIGVVDASSRISSVRGEMGLAPRASRRPSRWPRNLAMLSAVVTPASCRTLGAAWETARP